MAKDTIKFRIEEDGAVTEESDDFTQGEVHRQAEQLLKAVFDDLGGQKKTVRLKPGQPTHTHVHGTTKTGH